ncbi:MAG TPA: hypothetical protein VK634_17150 [Reyranella sp.]|nr:hypothetical protein [Reyranella sp.]HTE82415.1 hypothetical protein [Reyranella sp.]
MAAPYPLLDLFSGIGGFSLGLEATGGFATVAFCEANGLPNRMDRLHQLGNAVHPALVEVVGNAFLMMIETRGKDR